MPAITFRFGYRSPDGRPKLKTVIAESNADAFKLIAKFLKARSGRTLMPGTIWATTSYHVKDPPDIMSFLQHVTIQEGRDAISRAAERISGTGVTRETSEKILAGLPKSKFRVSDSFKNR